MNERELLELAAQAAGRLLPHGNPALTRPNEELHHDGEQYWFWPAGDYWNPLTDDGDALRLAAKLEIQVRWRTSAVDAHAGKFSTSEHIETYGKIKATRRAIVRAAAELGKAMQ